MLQTEDLPASPLVPVVSTVEGRCRVTLLLHHALASSWPTLLPDNHATHIKGLAMRPLSGIAWLLQRETEAAGMIAIFI